MGGNHLKKGMDVKYMHLLKWYKDIAHAQGVPGSSVKLLEENHLPQSFKYYRLVSLNSTHE